MTQVRRENDQSETEVGQVFDVSASSDAAERTFDSRLSARTKAALVGVVVAVAVASLLLGRYAMSPAEVIQAAGTYLSKLVAYVAMGLSDPTVFKTMGVGDISMTDAERVLVRIRLPRVIMVLMVGAALATAGAAFQGMFKNPLTSPDLLGASAGASVGACLALLWSLSGPYVQLFAFLGGLLAVGASVWLNGRVGSYDPTLGLVLAGMLVGTLFNSVMSLIKLVADSNDKLPEITFWLMGSFHDINLGDLVIAVPMIIGFVILLSQSWKLNVLSFGDEEARTLGVNTKRTRLAVIFAATLVTSAPVAAAGVVGWIGLVVPHLARALLGPNYKVLLPTSLFIGGAFLLVGDNLARFFAPVGIPIGLRAAILGGPFFGIIFKRNMGGWGR